MTTALDTKHPLYAENLDLWSQMRDTFKGEKAVKAAGQTYLPATSGHIEDGMTTADEAGSKAYAAYKKRAVFHHFVSRAVEAALGVMHRKPAVVELPPEMEYLIERATRSGESIQQLLRRVNEEQLITGRVGLLLDLPATPQTGEVQAYIAFYGAESIINWDSGDRDDLVLRNLNLVVLDESEYERKDIFDWELKKKFRVLLLGDPQLNEEAGSEVSYSVGVFKEPNASFREQDLTQPSIRGNTSQEIPFVFVNSKDILPEPDQPPLIGLSNLSLAIYRGEADYRQNLFMQGQDTLVVVGSSKGEDEDIRVGAGARIDVPAGGDAKYIGVTSEGLKEQREALQNDKGQAASEGGKLLEENTGERESGDALKIRVSARTATLTQIAQTGAGAVQELLRTLARWIGSDPEKVIVSPNLDFTDDELQGDDLVKFMTAKTLGAPLSRISIHKRMQDKGITEMEYEEEIKAIMEEEPLGGGDGTGEPDDDEGNQPGSQDDQE